MQSRSLHNFRIRILYITSTLKRSGPINQLYNLIKYLDRSRFEPYLLTLSPEPSDSRWQDFVDLGVYVDTLRLSRLMGIFLTRKRLSVYIRRIQPDLLHTQGIRADILSSVRAHATPRICTVHNFPQYDYALAYGKFLSQLIVPRHVNAMKQMDYCIGVSKAASTNLVKTFGLKNVNAIRNGVDTEFFFPLDHSNKQALRVQLGLPKNANIWVSSGNLIARKNPFFLLHSFQTWSAGNEQNFLIFLGGGPFEQELKKEAACTSNIMFIGHINNVVEYLQASDYFVSASQSEGFHYAMVEAFACGLPVLLSNIEAHKELVEVEPNIGALFELDDQSRLVNAFSDILARDKNVMSRAALSLVHRLLSAKKMSENYQKIYTQLMRLNS
jgi:glycosyltransferase involved in cell wall biosynthesis